MKPKPIPYVLMRELLDYCPDTGIFTHKVKRRGVKFGSIAGTIDDQGRRLIRIMGSVYFAHRLAFAWIHDFCPDNVDHRDLNSDNNRINNLRVATYSTNGANSRERHRSHVGLKGAYLVKSTGRWFAQITVNRKSRRLGTFDTPEQAHVAYVAAAAKIFGEFARAA